ncbi:type II CAAX prenyl endopeptidase Rce1 family protein [Microbacterium sp. OR16]|uniref:CPBP family glutamic-type intramembrane protease n=1 Tax=Microbacterium sp. OR16 TaxID=3095345 RepID=UPI0039B3D2D0
MTDAPAAAVRSSATRRRRDWRDGGRTVKPWDEPVLAISLVTLGLSLLLAAVIRGLSPAPSAWIVADLVVLLGLVVASVLAFMKARPRPLLTLRPVDLVFGLAAGLLLRVMQGALAVAAGGDGAFPSYAPLVESTGTAWSAVAVLAQVIVAPTVEEVFLRGVLLVTAYSVARRVGGRAAAVWAALAISVLGSIAVHSWNSGVSWEAWATPLAVGLVTGMMVLLTGRLGAAVVAHVTFALSFAALALIGAVVG